MVRSMIELNQSNRIPCLHKAIRVILESNYHTSQPRVLLVEIKESQLPDIPESVCEWVRWLAIKALAPLQSQPAESNYDMSHFKKNAIGADPNESSNVGHSCCCLIWLIFQFPHSLQARHYAHALHWRSKKNHLFPVQCNCDFIMFASVCVPANDSYI